MDKIAILKAIETYQKYEKDRYKNFDHNTQYIDNPRQYDRAEKRNDEIFKDVKTKRDELQQFIIDNGYNEIKLKSLCMLEFIEGQQHRFNNFILKIQLQQDNYFHNILSQLQYYNCMRKEKQYTIYDYMMDRDKIEMLKLMNNALLKKLGQQHNILFSSKY